MATNALTEVPLHVWLQIGGYVVSIICIVATVVWKVGQVRSDVRDSNTRLSGRVDLLQHTVNPYSEDIDGLKKSVAELQRGQSTTQARCDAHDRDVKRLENRIETINARR